MSVPERVSGLPAVSGPPSPSEWEAMRQQAEVIARSGMAPRSVSTPEKILVIAMKGRELSLPPMQALSHIHIVEGKPTLSAELMVALVQRAGHKLRVVETSSERCVVQGVRADDPDHPSDVAFSMDDAKRAGVAGKGPWKQYPAAMLRARAISALCRFQFADVLMGASYTPEEMGQNVGEEGEIISQLAPVRPISPPTVVDDEHQSVISEITDLLASSPEGYFGDPTKVKSYAEESLDKARVSLQRMKRMLDEGKPSEGVRGPQESATTSPEDFTDEDEALMDKFIAEENAGGEPEKVNPGSLPARRSQVELLITLAVDAAGPDGAQKLEKSIGKAFSDLSRDEADEWIEKLTPGSPATEDES